MKKFKITACGKKHEMQLTTIDPQYPPSCDSSERYEKDARKDAQTLKAFINELPWRTVLEFKKIFK